jgi:hypothetical protein
MKSLRASLWDCYSFTSMQRAQIAKVRCNHEREATSGPRWGWRGSKFRPKIFQLRANFATALRRASLDLDQPKDNVAQAFAGAAQDREHSDAAQPSERMISR